MNGARTHAWLRRVSDYCSGGVSAAERAAVEAHLAECAECRQALVTYRHFDALAHSLLWLGEGAVGVLPGYRPALQEESMITSDSDRDTGTTTTPPRPSRARLTTLGAIAAVVLISILAGALVALHRAPAHPATTPRTTPSVHVVSTSRQVLAGDTTPTVATCPAAEVALSGGWVVPAAGSVLASHRMGDGWGIVVQAPTGSGASVTASVTCLAHVPGATVQELSSSLTVASGASNYTRVDCPSGVSGGGGAVGGGFSTSSHSLDFEQFFLDFSLTTWIMEVKNSGPSAATFTLFAECFTAPGAAFMATGKYNTTIPQGGEQTITVECPTIPQGFFASGGGLVSGYPSTVRILGLAPASTALGWSVDLSAVGGAATVDVYVTCLSFS